jgi:hypothetical protein
MVLLQTVQTQMQSLLLLLHEPLMQMLLLLQEAEELAVDMTIIDAGMHKGVVDVEMDQGDSTRGKEVLF